MAVAPLPNVRQVVEYALTEIPASKIWLGVPLYGYDWPLPFVQGRTKAQSISPRRRWPGRSATVWISNTASRPRPLVPLY